MGRLKKSLWSAVAISGGALFVIDRLLKNAALNGTFGRWPADAGWVDFGIFRNNKFIGWLALPNWLVVFGSAIVLSAVAGLFIWSIVRRRLELSVCSGLIILGAVSNLADRIAYGWVIDYFGPGWGWPVFNLADIVILAGVIGLVASSRSFRSKTVDLESTPPPDQKSKD